MASTPSTDLRRIIAASGMTQYRIAAEAGINQSVLSRFMSGQTSLTTDSLDKLADVLLLEITTRRRTANAEKRK